MTRSHSIDRLRRLIFLTIYGVLMYLSQLLLAALPNIHMVAMLITVVTVVYRKWALIPIYVYAFLNGMYGIYVLLPYLYIWTLLWAIIMILPRSMPDKIAVPVYAIICGLHGMLFGLLYAPAQALLFGFSLEQTIAWIFAGLPYDLLHCAGNVVFSLLSVPLIKLLVRLEYVSSSVGSKKS